jgi:hypothetical protein
MATTNIKYNSAGTSITITLNSLAASATAGRQSTVIDNTSNLYDDAMVTVVISTSSSALASPNVVTCYISAEFDGVPNYDQDSAVMGASDAAYTIDSPTNLRLAAIINCSTSSKVYNKSFSVANACGGVMPSKWVLVVTNQTGQSLNSSGNSASYCGITYTTV